MGNGILGHAYRLTWFGAWYGLPHPVAVASGAAPQPCACPGGGDTVWWVYDGKLGVIGVVSCPYGPQEPCLDREELPAESGAIQFVGIPWLP